MTPAKADSPCSTPSTGKPQRSIPLPSYGGVAYLHHGQWIIVTDDEANPHAELHDASTLQSFGARFPTTDPDGVPIAVNNAGTIFSETERNPLLWNVDPADWIRTACTIAGRNLTQAEWRQYLPCPALPQHMPPMAARHRENAAPTARSPTRYLLLKPRARQQAADWDFWTNRVDHAESSGLPVHRHGRAG